ncbi:4-hydroxy-tetrahydrodipicolinate reductase [Buchnera aphidicola]|uniref:4-hydroxy-tetrahydrodipicolinate reductase n=1 Tax=Buchnera aphidicola TaxID=9 RepID=UPI003464A2A1
MHNKIIKIGITGAYGRMGSSILTEVKKYKNVICTCIIVKVINKKNCFYDKKIKITENIEKEINTFDVLIDFTTPKNTLNNLYICKKYQKNIIIGTTGFNESEMSIIKQYSKYIAIVFSANFSIGINVIFQMLKQATKMLDESYDIEILEKHHRNKIDSPSGTALKIGNIIAKYKKWNLNESSIYRKKEITKIRKSNQIGFSIIRGGNIIGEHEIMFLGAGENIIIKHQANNRNTFSNGAIQSAIWVITKEYGLFSMIDVLNMS